MDKFEQKEMKRIRPIKNTWYYWLINYICDMGETNSVWERKGTNKLKTQKQSLRT